MEEWSVSDKVKLRMENYKQQEENIPGTSTADSPPQRHTFEGPCSSKRRLVDILRQKDVDKTFEKFAKVTRCRELPTVRLHVGWLHFNERSREFSQVRSQKGGGVRFLTISRTSSFDSLLSKVTPLFFPGDESPKGLLKEMQYSLANFQGQTVEKNSFTMDRVLEKGQKSRIYLKTKRIKKEPESPEDDECEELPEVEWLDADTPTVSFKAKKSGTVLSMDPVCSSPAVEENFTLDVDCSSASDNSRPNVCAICADREKLSFIIPCGHTLCTVCALEVQEACGQCPFCKVDIIKVGSLFM